MKSLRILIIAVIFLGSCSGVCFADFKFAVIGDSRSDNLLGINMKILSEIMNKIKEEGVEFIIVTGDMITSSSNNAISGKRLKIWRDFIEKFNIPFYISMGNHEIKTELSEDIIRSTFDMPGNGPDVLKELVYSFDYNNAHFVAIDTNIYKNFHRFGDAQAEWLKKDLDMNTKKLIFIFGHEPFFPVHDHIGTSLDKYPEERDDMWKLFKSYGVDIYFCGHEHLYNAADIDGVYQVITGGAGARLRSSVKQGGFHHFVIVTVREDDTYGAIVKDIKGITVDSLKK